VQVTVAAVAVPVVDAVNPYEVDAPAATDPFQEALRTVTTLPVVVAVPLQRFTIRAPDGRVRVVVQLVRGVAPACTVTWPLNPPGQALVVA